MHPLTVRVRMLDAPFRADGAYDYLLPDMWADDCPPGQIVLVPFGRGNKPSYAVVVASGQWESDRRLKTVAAVLPPDFRLQKDILQLCHFLTEHTLCSLGEAARAAFPAAALGLVYEVYSAVPGKCPKAKGQAVYDCLLADPGQTVQQLGKEQASLLPGLIKNGCVLRQWRTKQELHARTVRSYRVALPPEECRARLADEKSFRNQTQRTLFRFLLEQGECQEQDILARLNISASPLQTLVSHGLLVCELREQLRDPYAALAAHPDKSPVALSHAQQTAYESLSDLLDRGKAACALLHGVTGSGKTRVMMKVLDKLLSNGRQAILMVPEIALTPQTVGIFVARYGTRVAVLHSRLSAGERMDAYRRILHGQIDLVIGTRSAVFAPLPRLGLIILDEEHEHTYKSDSAPRYHARDVAAYRAGQTGAMVLLASATPALESYYKAKTGKYTLVPLTERYGGAMLPMVEIIDMREELRAGNTSPISRRLHELLHRAKQDERQSVLFLNRRGFYHAVSCRACGEAIMCPHCSVSLSYHSDYGSPFLLCHACGYKTAMPHCCPNCGSEHLSFVGGGTQKAEAALLEEGLSVIRMDADTTGSKTAYERLLGRFRAGEADVLLGTQMVTKGHDFPKVTLAGVLLADSSLYMSDFRASERTFSLLTQVVGRAGRTREPGVAVIQTFCPDNQVIRLAAAQDYENFYEQQIALRRALVYPPFCDVAEVLLTGGEEKGLLEAATKAAQMLCALFEENKNIPAEIFGPLALQNYRVAEKYRVKLLVKCRLTKELRSLFGQFLRTFTSAFPLIGAVVDFNPTDT